MDEPVIIAHRALHRVSFAVLLIDGLTGAAITGSNARAWIEGERPPVKKGDGWFVFTDLEPKTYTVQFEGGHYQKQSVECTAGGESPQTIRVCLPPARTYPLPPGCLRIEGRAEPYAEITVFVPNRKSAFKLLADAESGTDTLKIYHGEAVNPEGETFRIQASDSTGENILVRKSLGSNSYRILHPLQNGYHRIGTLLVPASVSVSDGSGRFFMVIKGCHSTAAIVCEANGKSKVRKEYVRGDSNCICPDLRE